MTKHRIAVVGSVNLDLVVGVDRLPQPGETVLGGDVSYRSGGKGANQAVAAARYGAEVELHACIGSDGFGGRLIDELAGEGLDLARVKRVEAHPSGVALIVVDDAGSNTITVAAGANAALTGESFGVSSSVESAPDALLLQLEIPMAAATKAARRAAGLGIPVTLNASPLLTVIGDELRELIARTDVLVVNESEAATLHAVGDDWEQRARSLLEAGPRVVVVTLGADGAVAVSREETVIQAGFPVDPVDTTGAGDTFCGVLTTELVSGTGLTGAMRRACAAGAVATLRIGAREGMPTASEVERFLAERAVPEQNDQD
ncbi:ribokinase [Ruania albidiflava]|uniref:ribokinase n=1 Tax=Ruania albidiflava TaxID=366586 RepID=UPI0003B5B43D|nr:ribokinase [Ruania albidiflava]